MRVFLDENLSERVAEALNLLSYSYFPNIEVVSTKTTIGRGASDETIIPFIGNEKGILVTRDKGISRPQVHYELCRQHKVPVISIKLAKGSKRHWDLVKLLIRYWEDIVDEITSLRPPYVLQVSSKTGVKRLP